MVGGGGGVIKETGEKKGPRLGGGCEPIPSSRGE
jgi:hypothetical protein